MKKTLFFTLFLVCILHIAKATQLYNNEGVVLDHTITKQQTLFVAALNRNVVIWKSVVSLTNSNKKSIAVRMPCYLCYAYAYLNPFEISTVQEQVSNITISDVYKNYATPKPAMLAAKKTISNEEYFATFDDVDLRTAIMNWDIKYSFWE